MTHVRSIKASLLTSAAMLLALSGCGSALQSYSTSAPLSLTTGVPDGGVMYMLPKAALNVVLKKAGKIYVVEISAPQYIGDVSAAYVLHYAGSALSSDTVDIGVDPATGLLTKVYLTAADKTDDIVVELAKSVVALESAVETPAAEVLFDRQFIPGSGGTSLVDFQADMRRAAQLDALVFIVDPLYQASSTGVQPADCTVGVCYRMPVPYLIGFGFNGTVTYSRMVSLPNDGPVVPLEFSRAAGVTKVTNVDFVNGTPATAHLDKPSEGLEFAALPLNVAKAILSVPAELVQLKVDLSGKEEALATQEKARIEAETALKKAKLDARGNEDARQTGRQVLLQASTGPIGRSGGQLQILTDPNDFRTPGSSGSAGSGGQVSVGGNPVDLQTPGSTGSTGSAGTGGTTTP